jgi:hypothetical protein
MAFMNEPGNLFKGHGGRQVSSSHVDSHTHMFQPHPWQSAYPRDAFPPLIETGPPMFTPFPMMAFGDYSDSPLDFCLTGSDAVYVLDPAGRDTGVYSVLVPREHILETRAVHAYSSTDKPPSLCMLFQNGNCRMGSQCQQVHVLPEIMQHIRSFCSTLGTCCFHHGDVHSVNVTCPMAQLSMQFPNVSLMLRDGRKLKVPLTALAWTTCLEKLLSQSLSSGVGVPGFSFTQVCRVHQLQRCSYGKACRHIHLCREYWKIVLKMFPTTATTPSPAPRPQAATVTHSALVDLNAFSGGLGGVETLGNTPNQVVIPWLVKQPRSAALPETSAATSATTTTTRPVSESNSLKSTITAMSTSKTLSKPTVEVIQPSSVHPVISCQPLLTKELPKADQSTAKMGIHGQRDVKFPSPAVVCSQPVNKFYGVNPNVPIVCIAPNQVALNPTCVGVAPKVKPGQLLLPASTAFSKSNVCSALHKTQPTIPASTSSSNSDEIAHEVVANSASLPMTNSQPSAKEGSSLSSSLSDGTLDENNLSENFLLKAVCQSVRTNNMSEATCQIFAAPFLDDIVGKSIVHEGYPHADSSVLGTENSLNAKDPEAITAEAIPSCTTALFQSVDTEALLTATTLLSNLSVNTTLSNAVIFSAAPAVASYDNTTDTSDTAASIATVDSSTSIPSDASSDDISKILRTIYDEIVKDRLSLVDSQSRRNSQELPDWTTTLLRRVSESNITASSSHDIDNPSLIGANSELEGADNPKLKPLNTPSPYRA